MNRHTKEVYVGRFSYDDHLKGIDEEALKKAKKDTGLKFIRTEIVKRNKYRVEEIDMWLSGRVVK